jgi:regulator of nonsense transcripts 2
VLLGERQQLEDNTQIEGADKLEVLDLEAVNNPAEQGSPTEGDLIEANEDAEAQREPQSETQGDDDADEKAKDEAGSSKAEFEALVARMPNALSRDSIDQLAVQFCFLNSKPARKRMVKHLVGVSRNRLDILPYYARFIATIHPFMPEIGQSVLESVRFCCLHLSI